MITQTRQRFGPVTLRLLVLLLSFVLALPALAEVHARLDRSSVYIGDPVTLVIEKSGNSDGEPDLAPLRKDFRLLGTGTSTRFSMINGRTSKRTTWTIQLGPIGAGKLTIPPITVGNEKTKPLELVVTDVPDQVKARQSEHLFIEVEADTARPIYVQQQIPYTLRFFYDERLLSGELQSPSLPTAVIQKLGEDRRYQVTRNNRSYQVLERRYAISPEKSGKLHIPPASFVGRLKNPQRSAAPRNRGDDLIQRFFGNDPFFSNTPFGNGGTPVRIHSRAVDLEVLARPTQKGGNWLPAEDIELHDSWAEDPPQLRVGEPVTRTIELRAVGLSGAQIPELPVRQPTDTRLYPETPVNESHTDGDKVYARSRQTFTYIPGRAGELTIPAVELDWWNTTTDQAATVRLPRWSFQVEPGTGVKGSTKAPARPLPRAQDEASPGKSDAAARTLAKAPAEDDNSNATANPAWWWLIVVVVLIAIGGFALRWLAHRNLQRDRADLSVATSAAPRPKIDRILPRLQQACEANDARATAQALFELGRARWPDDPPRSLGALATRLGAGQPQIVALDRALYAPDRSDWKGAELWQAVMDAWGASAVKSAADEEALKPLYPTG